MKRYIVVGGVPFTGYTGTTTFTSLKVVCSTDNLEEAKQLVKNNYDECGGLLLALDTETGAEF